MPVVGLIDARISFLSISEQVPNVGGFTEAMKVAGWCEA